VAVLDLARLDLENLATALDDHSEFGTSWWIDAETGEIWPWSDDLGDDLGPDYDPEERESARRIDPLPSRVGYRDMAAFIELVPDRRAADLLARAIAGRGAFRRFKDTLFEFPELRQAWLRFRDVRMRRRAIEYLVDEQLVDETAAEELLATLIDPPVDVEPAERAPARARALAADLHRLYGERLAEVALITGGSRPREDDPIDVVVVLDRVDGFAQELQRMDGVLRGGPGEEAAAAVVVSREDWEQARRPLVRALRADARRLG
jgi:hypothetical protein